MEAIQTPPPISSGAIRGSRVINIGLTPGAYYRVPFQGVRFYIVESDSDTALEIKTDKTPDELFTVGTGKEFTEEQAFNVITIHNPSVTETITITFFVGWGNFIDNRTTIVGNRLSSILPVRDSVSKTVFISSSIPATPGGYLLPGTATGIYMQRKALIVSNNDPNLDLRITDGSGATRNLDKIVCIVKPNSSSIYPCSGLLGVYNPNPTAVDCAVSEIWYTKPGF